MIMIILFNYKKSNVNRKRSSIELYTFPAILGFSQKEVLKSKVELSSDSNF